MSADLHTAPRLCPACDYDLQGNDSGRCPECGLAAGTGPFSAIPWVHRQYRGGRDAYLQTLFILLFRPAQLARETARRVALAHARKFHRESLLLGTIFLTGVSSIIFLVRGPSVDFFVAPSVRRLLVGNAGPLPVTPIFVLSDSLLVIIPLAITIFFSLALTAWTYRRLFASGPSATPAAARARRRVRALGYYASGLMAPVGLLLGVATVTTILLLDLALPISAIIRALIWIALVLSTLAALWTFYFPTLTLVWRTQLAPRGKANYLRLFFMIYLFPLLQPFVWTAVAVVVFWVVGLIAILVSSLMN